ncbi:MAG: DUF1016 N-terminal domain-containing protein [Methanomassiliicoccaceae archaeon]|nr:DUF1016 N-terminal domain-containing protein [Methanomassiliicoccaceae archaeon]
MEYHDVEKLQPLVGEISWAKHVVILNRCKDNLERQFYIMSAKKFGWTKAVLIHQIDSRSYERHLLNQTSFEQPVISVSFYNAFVTFEAVKPNALRLTIYM